MSHEAAPLTPRADGLPTISVMVPVLNEENTLPQCLEALHAGHDLPDEIVIVDNGSTDRTVEVAEAFPLVRVVHEPRRGISYGRATGFDAVRGDIVGRIDADTIVSPEWIATIRSSFFEHPEWSAVCGGAAVAELSPRDRFWFGAWYRIFRFWHERSIGVRPMIYGFNGAIRKEAWDVAKDLLVVDDSRVSEDVDLTISLLRTGHEVHYLPKMRVKAGLFRSMEREKLKRYYLTDGMTLERHQFGRKKRWVREEDVA